MRILWRYKTPVNRFPANQTPKMKPTIEGDIIPIFKSVFSLNLKMEILLTTIFGGFTFGAVTGFTANWIFEPAISFYFLLLLIAADHFTGMSVAWRRGKFETRKALRVFWTLLAHTWLLVFATNLSRGSVALYWLNEGIFVPLVLVNMISLVKNLSLMGLVNKQFTVLFYKKVDTYKNEFAQTTNEMVGDPVDDRGDQ